LRFQAITHPDDLATDVAIADRLARGEILRYQLEKRYIRKDEAIVDACRVFRFFADEMARPCTTCLRYKTSPRESASS
jgi:hypothetical protein